MEPIAKEAVGKMGDLDAQAPPTNLLVLNLVEARFPFGFSCTVLFGSSQVKGCTAGAGPQRLGPPPCQAPTNMGWGFGKMSHIPPWVGLPVPQSLSPFQSHKMGSHELRPCSKILNPLRC